MNSKKTLQSKINGAKKLTENLRGVYVDISKVNAAKTDLFPKPFRTILTHNGNRYSLGYYENPQEAAIAYNKKAKTIFKSEKKAQAAGFWNF